MNGYDEYLTKYAAKQKISKEEAEKHVVVKEAKDYYEKNDHAQKMAGWKEE